MAKRAHQKRGKPNRRESALDERDEREHRARLGITRRERWVTLHPHAPSASPGCEATLNGHEQPAAHRNVRTTSSSIRSNQDPSRKPLRRARLRRAEAEASTSLDLDGRIGERFGLAPRRGSADRGAFHCGLHIAFAGARESDLASEAKRARPGAGGTLPHLLG